MRETQRKKRIGLLIPAILTGVLLLIVLVMAILIMKPKSTEPEVISIPTLDKIINISELSTYTAVYNGITKVYNEKKSEKVDYYVAYEAKVNAGIEFEKVNIDVDTAEKTILVQIPDITITEVIVDVTSLEFIFQNDKANTSSVSQEALKACEKDVREESEKENAIYELARQNAVNILTALVKPFVEQLDAEYTLVVK